MGPAEQSQAGIVNKLEAVFAVKGKEGGMHDFENAGQQSGGFKRTDALLLQEVGESVDLGRKFAQCVLQSLPRAHGRSNRPREATRQRWRGLQRADHTLNQRAATMDEVENRQTGHKQGRSEG